MPSTLVAPPARRGRPPLKREHSVITPTVAPVPVPAPQPPIVQPKPTPTYDQVLRETVCDLLRDASKTVDATPYAVDVKALEDALYQAGMAYRTLTSAVENLRVRTYRQTRVRQTLRDGIW